MQNMIVTTNCSIIISLTVSSMQKMIATTNYSIDNRLTKAGHGNPNPVKNDTKKKGTEKEWFIESSLRNFTYRSGPCAKVLQQNGTRLCPKNRPAL